MGGIVHPDRKVCNGVLHGDKPCHRQAGHEGPCANFYAKASEEEQRLHHIPVDGCAACVTGHGHALDEFTTAISQVFDDEDPTSPPHYRHGKIEPYDVIEDWKLGPWLANVVKYIARADHKGTPLEDLAKARRYLDREIWRRTRDE